MDHREIEKTQGIRGLCEMKVKQTSKVQVVMGELETQTVKRPLGESPVKTEMENRQRRVALVLAKAMVMWMSQRMAGQ
jgi:hypothetical protein